MLPFYNPNVFILSLISVGAPEAGASLPLWGVFNLWVLWSTTAETKNGLQESNKPLTSPQVSGFKKFKEKNYEKRQNYGYLVLMFPLGILLFVHRNVSSPPEVVWCTLEEALSCTPPLAPLEPGDASWISFVSLGFNLLVTNTFQLIRRRPRHRSVWMRPPDDPAANLWAAERSGPLRRFPPFMSMLHFFLEITLRRV